MTQTRAAVRSLSCRCETVIPAHRAINPYDGKMTDRPARTVVMKWVERDGVARATTWDQGSPPDVEFLWKNGELKHLQLHTNGPAKGVGRLDGPEGINHVGAMWWTLMLGERYDFLEQLTPERVTEAVATELDGRKCFRITWAKDAWSQQVWFDIGCNYWLRKVVMAIDAKNPTRSQYEVRAERLTEVKPGIYLPTFIESRSYNDGKLTEQFRETTRVLDIKVNEPVADDQLQLKFPAGITVHDTRKGVHYVIDENEQPVGTPEKSPPPRNLQANIQYPTAMQPESSNTWVWAVLGGVLVSVLVVIIVVRRNRRNALAADGGTA